jgi:hypothetical protein
LGVVLLVLLGAAWFAALLALGIDGWRQSDNSTQFVAMLTVAYGILGALMGYLGERGADLGQAFALGVAGAFLPALLALLLFAAGLWLEKRRLATGLLAAAVLLFVAIAVLAGTLFVAATPLARTITDPQVYAGPLGWLTGCAARPAAPERTAAPEATVEAEKEVEREATKVVEKAATVTATPLPAPTPTAAATSPPKEEPTPVATPQPAVTASPAPAQPTATPLIKPALPPPLLGQYVPETILWLPEVVTDAQGQISLDIPLPQVAATWRLTVLASTSRGELGGETSLIRVE